MEYFLFLFQNDNYHLIIRFPDSHWGYLWIIHHRLCKIDLVTVKFSHAHSKNHTLHVRNFTYRAKNHTLHVRNFTYRAKNHTLHVRNFTYRAKKHILHVRNFTYRAKITLYTFAILPTEQKSTLRTFAILPTEQKSHFSRSQCYIQSKNHTLHVRNVTYRAKITLYTFAMLPVSMDSRHWLTDRPTHKIIHPLNSN